MSARRWHTVGAPGGPAEEAPVSSDDATVRLPGDRGDADGRYATDSYGEVPDRGFGVGGEQPAVPTPGYRPDEPRYETGQAAYRAPETDQTLVLGGAGWEPDEAPPRPPRDRLLVHGVWELLLAVGVAGMVAFCYVNQPGLFSSAGLRVLELQAATLGLLALAVSLSVRAAAPNLAVGAFAAVAGLLFARGYDGGVAGALAPALGVALLGGLALGVLVALLHVPAWAASLVALCGGFVTMTAVDHGRAVSLPTSAPDPARTALYWCVGVAAVSVVFGVVGLTGPARRGVGAFRPVADPAVRRGPGAALMAVVALTVSAGLAGGAGVLTVAHARTTDGGGAMLSDLLLALGAVLLGGVSAYGRRGGLFGTALGVAAVLVVLRYGEIRGWPTAVTTYSVAGGAIALGLVVTRLVEWAGHPRPRTEG